MQPGFVRFVLGQVELEPQIDGLRRFPLELPPTRDPVLVAEVLAGVPVALPGAPLFGGHREPAREAVGQRSGQVALGIHLVV